MSLEEYFGDWLKVIDVPILNKVVIAVNYQYSLHPVVPEYNDIFKAFTLCSLHDCKIVFLGQDPYPQKDVATGILFANKKDKSPLSPSLQVIKEACMKSSQDGEFDQTLLKWCNQGCLMLNSALTVECNKPQSHALIWRPFISSFLLNLSRAETGIIYVLMGNNARSFRPYINETYNTVIETYHPAYYARNNEDMPPEIFVHINELLIDKYGIPIKW